MKEHDVLVELRRLCGAGGAGLRARLRIDQRWYGSPFLAVEPFVPVRGRIVDAGCGFGMFAAILALRSGEREVYGLDIDADKIARAQLWFGGLPGVRFEARDLGEWAGFGGRVRGGVDCVVFYDVLHHLRAELIGKVLAAARAVLREGGVLVIKENDMRPAWKYAVSCLVERVAVGSGLTQSDPVVFRSCGEWAGWVKQAGFTVEHAAHLPAREGFFVPHSLILGRV